MVAIKFPQLFSGAPFVSPPPAAASQTPLARRLDVPSLPRSSTATKVPEPTPTSLGGKVAKFFRDHDKATAGVLMGASMLASGCATMVHAAPTSTFDRSMTTEQRDAAFEAKIAEINAQKGKLPYSQIAKMRADVLKDYAASQPATLTKVDADKDGVNLATEMLFGSSDAKVDSDTDGMGDNFEIKNGLDPSDAQAVGTTTVKTWTHGYIPMSHNPMIEGRGMLHYDLLMRDRTGTDPKMRHEEGASGLAKGHYFLSGSLDEKDAEMTSGYDFNGDGVLTPGVKWDFLKAGLGDASFGTDGKTDATLNVSWWGHCNDVATAGINFREPKMAVEYDLAKPFTVTTLQTKHGSFQAESVKPGATHTDLVLISGQTMRLANADITSQTKETITKVTFTADQLKELTSELVHRGSKLGHDWVGNRFEGRPALIQLKDGSQVYGALTSSLEDRAKVVGQGEITATDFTKDVTADVFDYSTGKIESKTFKASEIKRIQAENKRDVAPVDFHTTMLKWLGSDGTAGVMDKDSGPHVWNYSFDKYEYSHTPREGDASTIDYTMKVSFVGNAYPVSYDYSITYDAQGVPVKGDWKESSPNPDFFWRDRGGMEAFDHSGGGGTDVQYKTVMELLNKSWALEDAQN